MLPQPLQRDLRAARARHRPRHPGHDDLHRESAPAARASRSRAGPAPRAVRRGRDRLLARGRAARRVLSERLHRRAVVVPRRTRRGAAVPRRRSPRRRASTAARGSSTTPARSSPFRRATTWLAGSIRRSWPGSCARAGCRQAAAERIAVDLVDALPAEGLQAVTSHRRRRPEPPRARRAHGTSVDPRPGAHRAPRSRRVPPRASGVVHRRRRRRERVGDRRLHRAQPARRRGAAGAGRSVLAAGPLGGRRRHPCRRQHLRGRRRRPGRPPHRHAVAAPATALVTLTITEAGYALDADGRPDVANPAVAADVDWLAPQPRCSALRPVATRRARRSARLLAGIEARRRAGRGRSRDRLVRQPARERRGDPRRTARASPSSPAPPRPASYVAEHVAFVSTSIDRITPKTTADDVAAVAAATGWARPRAGRHRALPRLGALRGGSPAAARRGSAAARGSSTTSTRSSAASCWLLNGSHTLHGLRRAPRAGIAPSPRRSAIRSCARGSRSSGARRSGTCRPRGSTSTPTVRHCSIGSTTPASSTCSTRSGRTARRSFACASLPLLKAERAAGRDGAASVRALGAWVAAATARRAARRPRRGGARRRGYASRGACRGRAARPRRRRARRRPVDRRCSGRRGTAAFDASALTSTRDAMPHQLWQSVAIHVEIMIHLNAIGCHTAPTARPNAETRRRKDAKERHTPC